MTSRSRLKCIFEMKGHRHLFLVTFTIKISCDSARARFWQLLFVIRWSALFLNINLGTTRKTSNLMILIIRLQIPWSVTRLSLRSGPPWRSLCVQIMPWLWMVHWVISKPCIFLPIPVMIWRSILRVPRRIWQLWIFLESLRVFQSRWNFCVAWFQIWVIIKSALKWKTDLEFQSIKWVIVQGK